MVDPKRCCRKQNRRVFVYSGGEFSVSALSFGFRILKVGSVVFSYLRIKTIKSSASQLVT